MGIIQQKFLLSVTITTHQQAPTRQLQKDNKSLIGEGLTSETKATKRELAVL